LGFVLINLRHIASWTAARRMRNRGVCVAPVIWQQKLHDLQKRLKVAKPVLLLESCLTQVPIVIGHLRPAILVPIGLLTGFPTEHVVASDARTCAYRPL
jgi:bla regulator protein BlaR1